MFSSPHEHYNTHCYVDHMSPNSTSTCIRFQYAFKTAMLKTITKINIIKSSEYYKEKSALLSITPAEEHIIKL